MSDMIPRTKPDPTIECRGVIRLRNGSVVYVSDPDPATRIVEALESGEFKALDFTLTDGHKAWIVLAAIDAIVHPDSSA